MKNIKFSRLFAAFAFVAILALAGCKQNVEPEKNYYYVLPLEANDSLIADWVDSTSTHYEITQNSFDNHGTFGNSYAGDNLVVLKSSDTAGIIFIKFTRAANPDWTYTASAPDVGKWYAVSYKDLTASSIKISGAYKKNGKTACTTLKDAVKEFTVDNGYFAAYSDCTKQ